MSDLPTAGICPSCEGTGVVGEPCAADRCVRLGHHHIPRVHFEPLTKTHDPLVGQRWGSYLLAGRLGEGGVGAVYLALQQPVGLKTALKVLHARTGQHPALAERFDAEAEALARLGHPNIVRLLGTGAAHGRAYLAMEFIDGGRTLADAMRVGIDRASARRILLQMVDALDAAHRAGVIHRDIKPANVMLQSTSREPCFVRIVDFGLAKFTDHGASTQLAAGTPAYMAPEQVLRDDIGPWTDWYALGVIACELLVGRRPFPAVTSRELLRLKVTGPFDPVAELDAPDLQPEVRYLIARTLAREPLERPGSAREMTALIEAACASMAGVRARRTLVSRHTPLDEPSGGGTSDHMGGVIEPLAGVEPPASAPRWLGGVVVCALFVAMVGGRGVSGTDAEGGASGLDSGVSLHPLPRAFTSGRAASTGAPASPRPADSGTGARAAGRAVDAGAPREAPVAQPIAHADAGPSDAAQAPHRVTPAPRAPAPKARRRTKRPPRSKAPAPRTRARARRSQPPSAPARPRRSSRTGDAPLGSAPERPAKASPPPRKDRLPVEIDEL